MLILAFDTALRSCSVALRRDETILAARAEAARHRDRDMLMPMIRDVLKDADCHWREVERLALTVGPGSFTGVRIGIAACRGLSLVRDIPVIGLNCLECVAAGIFARSSTARRRPQRIVLPLDESHWGTQAFVADPGAEGFRPVDDPACVDADAIETWKADQDIHAPRSREDRRFLPDPTVFSRLALFRRPLAKGVEIQPLYLRPHYAQTPPQAPG